ncbi:MAG: hypothetical protein KDA78_15780 [Planctomycetaceae bacterium]|nr:hypothetical protein [Planctomycetaceae bacterium]
MSSLRFWIVVVCMIGTWNLQDLYARGGGRLGGGGGGGGVSRPNVSKPNVSKPNISKPNINQPQISNVKRPEINAPNIKNKASSYAPSLSREKPNLNVPNKLPSQLPNQKLPQVNPPNIHRPDVNLPNGNRPNLNNPNVKLPNNNLPVHGNRPNSNDLKDFLNLPGNGRPSTLPAKVRPDIDINRPNNVNRPAVGNRINTGDININRQTQINTVRNRWNNVNARPFHNPNWWNNYPVTLPAWRWHAGWNNNPPGWCWRHCGWTTFGTWFVWQAWTTPVYYDYGNTVVYQDNYVYVDNQPVATVDQYYEQAADISAAIPESTDTANVEWMPLGVFAITEENATESGFLLQLAVSKEGLIAGTLWNEMSGVSRPVEGTVDRESQRAAWKFSDGKNPEIVMETGIYNLTLDEATALVHHGSLKTETWLMVRLPEEDSSTSNSPNQ